MVVENVLNLEESEGGDDGDSANVEYAASVSDLNVESMEGDVNAENLEDDGAERVKGEDVEGGVHSANDEHSGHSQPLPPPPTLPSPPPPQGVEGDVKHLKAEGATSVEEDAGDTANVTGAAIVEFDVSGENVEGEGESVNHDENLGGEGENDDGMEGDRAVNAVVAAPYSSVFKVEV